MTKFRRVEIIVDGSWFEIVFEHLRPGNVFRYFEDSSGTQPVSENGISAFRCLTTPVEVPDEEGNWKCEADDVSDEEVASHLRPISSQSERAS
jgi:hypothetical protein